MKKPLLIVENNAEMQSFKNELDKGYEMFKEAQEFAKKQQEASWKQLIGSKWEKIEAVLKERNLLPEDFCDEKYSLGFRDGVLYLTDKNDDPRHDMAKGIFDMLFKKD